MKKTLSALALAACVAALTPAAAQTTGALASVTSVPTATPVFAVPVKKKGWYAAVASTAMRVGRNGHLPPPENERRTRATASNATPPIATRSAPTSRDVAPTGASACEVPVVPQSMAPSRTKSAPPECVVFSCIVLNPFRIHPRNKNPEHVRRGKMCKYGSLYSPSVQYSRTEKKRISSPAIM